MNRRGFLATGLAAVAAGLPAAAHTPHGQWVVYRRKHLLIGCHKTDPATYDLALRLVETLEHELAEASARVARAPHPERLASLMATEQMDAAILSEEAAQKMSAGAETFSAYGPVPLRLIAPLADHLFVVTDRMPERHAWLLASALEDRAEASAAVEVRGVPWHPGALKFRSGEALLSLPEPG